MDNTVRSRWTRRGHDAMKGNLSMNQSLPLSFGFSESDLKRYLEIGLSRPVSLVFTDNSTSMLSARQRENILQVRMHRMFMHADGNVLDEIVSFLKNRSRSMPCFRTFVRGRAAQLSAKAPNKVRLRTRGRVYDLDELYCEMNESYFGGRVNAAITWGTGSARSRVRKRTLGSYSERSHLIRINPLLDNRNIPRYVTAFVVYHEMLHAAIGITRQGGRRSIHSQEFRRRERLFLDHEKALAWERTCGIARDGKKL